MSQNRCKLSVIIVSYNTREMTLNCLERLHADIHGLSVDVWLVDNAGSDGTAQAVREAYPEVNVLEMPANMGFGAANNEAMRRAQGEYFLLLNSDAFPHKGAVSTLANYLDQCPGVGVVGPRLVNADGSLQLSCFRFPSPRQAWLENIWISPLFPNHPTLGDYRKWDHNRERHVDFVIGACLLMRRSVYEGIGGFDPHFFLYAEESDLQRRIADAGWLIAFTPKAVVTHLGGASGIAAPGAIRECFFSSLDRYARKHHGIAGVISFRAAMIVGCFLRALLWAGMAAFHPERREASLTKLRLQIWLLKRQITCWKPILAIPIQERNPA